MKVLSQNLLARVACLAVVGGSVLPGAAADQSLAEFEAKEETSKLDWRVVNDGVMGGLSKGQLSFTDSGVLQFKGTLSLENNGGFSSLRTGNLNLDLSGQEGIALRVRGDGRTYQLRLGSDARYRGREVSFQADFPTESGKWTEVKVPFTDFKGSWRGRILEEEELKTGKIQRLGLLLADKKPGEFNLEVDWVRAYRSASDGNIVELAVADGRFKTLAAALQNAELVSLLQGEGPFTVFAPTDEAFARLPEGTVETLLKPENLDQLQAVLKYHVSPGVTKLAGALQAGSISTAQGSSLSVAFKDGRVQINDAPLRNADVVASNGVIHVIDSVLLPPAPKPATDIVGVARQAGKFKTLLAAVEAAGLLEALQSEGPITVLAPTDEAFAALPAGTVESLLKEENRDQLKSILSYHAFAGSISAGDALNARKAEALNGATVTFSIQDGRLKANQATIVTTDITCDNGVIHVIDAVLLPPKKSSDEDRTSAENSADPAALIAAAIDRGVPAFNNGQVEECASIYQRCLEELASNQGLDARMRKGLQMILDRAASARSDRDRAWLYRHTLDGVVHALTSKG